MKFKPIKFKKSFHGYDKDEVDAYVKKIEYIKGLKPLVLKRFLEQGGFSPLQLRELKKRRMRIEKKNRKSA
jgi:DivIVA domain-containing protein